MDVHVFLVELFTDDEINGLKELSENLAKDEQYIELDDVLKEQQL